MSKTKIVSSEVDAALKEVEYQIWDQIDKSPRSLVGGLYRALEMVRIARGVDPDDNSEVMSR